jgi:AraC family transcriptional regulator of adaptative response/methylated-DNA-[protein]-cysteine methyltransferase
MEVIISSEIEEYYQALLNRDSKYIGIFYVGVKTTLVFCIATCRARKPKKKNVVFYKTYTEALKNGFRPCKICCPTENSNETPEQVARAIRIIKDNPKKKISDAKLRAVDISPDLVRRWFKKNYGITFHAFQRMYRINNAYKELKDGKTTTATAFGLGYESLSGFGYTYKKIIGQSPTNSKSENIILINKLTTPLGPMFVCATDKGICLLEFTDRKMLETEFKDLQKKRNAKILIGENEHTKRVRKEIKAYFDGECTTFQVPLDVIGTDFQQKAWKALIEVSFGLTATYQQQATKINKPNAIKAVANANGFNRISIIIPCHRIVGENGDLMGYGGGIARKKWLIEFEKKVLEQQQNL